MKSLICIVLLLGLISSQEFVTVGEIQAAIADCTTFYCVGFGCLSEEDGEIRDAVMASDDCAKFGKVQGKQGGNAEELLSLEFVTEGVRCTASIRDHLSHNFYGRSRYQCCVDIFNKARDINKKYIDGLISDRDEDY